MGKLLFWLGVAAVAYLAYQFVHTSQRRSERSASARSGPRRETPGEPMRRCAHCGVYLPDSDALSDRGRFFCSPAHRDEARRA